MLYLEFLHLVQFREETKFKLLQYCNTVGEPEKAKKNEYSNPVNTVISRGQMQLALQEEKCYLWADHLQEDKCYLLEREFYAIILTRGQMLLGHMIP